MKNRLFKRLCVSVLAFTLVVGMTACGSSGGDKDAAATKVAEGKTTEGTAAEGSEAPAAAYQPDKYGFVDGTIEEGEFYLNDFADEEYAVNGEVKDIKDSAGDLNAARLAYFVLDNDGDQEFAKEQLESEFEEAPEFTAEQQKLVKSVYPKIAIFFAKYGIETYDLTKPYEADEVSVYFDVYPKDSKNRFDVCINIDEGKVEGIDFESY